MRQCRWCFRSFKRFTVVFVGLVFVLLELWYSHELQSHSGYFYWWYNWNLKHPPVLPTEYIPLDPPPVTLPTSPPPHSSSSSSNNASIAWLIMTHNVEHGLEPCVHLLLQVYRPGDTVVIHIDVDAGMFAEDYAHRFVVPQFPAGAVTIMRVYEGQWGKPSLVRIAWVMLQRALSLIDTPDASSSTNKARLAPWSVAVFLSGDSYPIQSQDIIRHRLTNPAVNRLHEDGLGPVLDRTKELERYSQTMKTKLAPILKNRGRMIWHGTQWVVLRQDTARWLMSDALVRVLYESVEQISIPDESFFQMALIELLSSPWSMDLTTLRQRVWDKHMLTHWRRLDHVFQLDEVPRIMQSGAMFARKIRTQAIRQEIDTAVANGENPFPPIKQRVRPPFRF